MPDPAIVIEARRALRESVAVYNRILASRFEQKRALKELGEKLLPYRRQVPFGVWADLLAEFGINRHTWRRAKALAEGKPDYWKKVRDIPDNFGDTHPSGVIRLQRENSGDTGDTGDRRAREGVAPVAVMRRTLAVGAVVSSGGAAVPAQASPAGAGLGVAGAGGNRRQPVDGGGRQLKLDSLYKEAESLRVELQTRVARCLEMVRTGDGVGVQALRASRDAIKAVMEGI